MRYSTLDYLRDSHWYIDLPISLWEKLKPKIKKVGISLIEFEYDTYVFRVAENLPYALIIVFLGLVAVLTLAKYSEKENGTRVSTITTNSMHPAITAGSIVISTPAEKYSEGDIITYREVNPKTGLETGRAITHRIISDKAAGKAAGEEKMYVTKGDANRQPDPGVVKKDQIFGKVSLILPYVGYFETLVKTLPGFVILIFLPAMLLIKNELDYIRKEVKMHSKKNELVGL